jgi:hypothetical protein
LTVRWAQALKVAAIPLLLYGCAAQQPVVVETDVPRGHVIVRPGRAGFVIAAPHGSSDPPTGHFAAELARRTGFGLVVAAGFATEPDRAYERRVQDAARGALTYYAEFHGPGRLESNRIEIATVGIDAGLAQRLRSLYELIRDAHLRGYPKAPRVDALVEPADKLFYGATGGRRDGSLRLPARALHVELPRVTRTEARDLYLAILADFLTQAAQLPAGR